MSNARPLIQSRTFVRYGARDWMHREDAFDADSEDKVWTALAAWCVMRLRERQKVRFSFPDDAEVVKRAERLLRALDKR